MATVTLDGTSITDWPSFHAASKRAFGFPDSYGANMDAWIDSLSDLRDEYGMTRFVLEPDEVLEIELEHSGKVRRAAPHIIEALQDCVDEVNQRYLDAGEAAALALVLR